MRSTYLCAGLLTLLMQNTLVQAEPPALPAGLDDSGPSLPAGLGNSGPSLPTGLESNPNPAPSSTTGDSPVLPEGLGAMPAVEDNRQFENDSLPISGFWEARGGLRIGDDTGQRHTSLAETRLQLEMEKSWSSVTFKLTTDLLLDDLADTQQIDLESGEGWLDLRNAYVSFSPASFVDVRAGRQILTWGTGDLLFINDLFPKDWKAFFTGRDVEYLKAPSDAIRSSWFSPWFNVDLVYTPSFDPDRFISGQRLSYFAPSLGRIAGRDAQISVDRPYDDEIALRVYRRFSAWETALYAYDGFWKSPAGQDAVSGHALFPRLRSFGASARGPLAKGIASVETGYYDSRDDTEGSNPLINNSEWRLLLGYEQEIAQNLTLGGQYYLEVLQDYDAYRISLPAGLPARDEDRHLFTVRLTWLTHQQNLRWSLFAYYSPSDKDAYLRPSIQYKLDDHWRVDAGANLFGGDAQHTFFGQFRDNTNAWLAIRYGF